MNEPTVTDPAPRHLSAERLAWIREKITEPGSMQVYPGLVAEVFAHVDAQAATIEDLTAERDRLDLAVRREADAADSAARGFAAWGASLEDAPVLPERPDLEPLRGRDLLCWCKPGDPCHADTLLELANR